MIEKLDANQIQVNNKISKVFKDGIATFNEFELQEQTLNSENLSGDLDKMMEILNVNPSKTSSVEEMEAIQKNAQEIA